MIEKGYVDEYYEKLGDWGGVTGYLRTGPNADASLAKVVAFKERASSFCVMIPSKPEGMILLSSGDGIDRLSNAKTRRQTPSASFIK